MFDPDRIGEVGTIWEVEGALSPKASWRRATAVTRGDLNLSPAIGAEKTSSYFMLSMMDSFLNLLTFDDRKRSLVMGERGIARGQIGPDWLSNGLAW